MLQLRCLHPTFDCRFLKGQRSQKNKKDKNTKKQKKNKINKNKKKTNKSKKTKMHWINKIRRISGHLTLPTVYLAIIRCSGHLNVYILFPENGMIFYIYKWTNKTKLAILNCCDCCPLMMIMNNIYNLSANAICMRTYFLFIVAIALAIVVLENII